MPALHTLANPDSILLLQTLSISLLFYGLPSWFLYRVRAASWVSLSGAALFFVSCTLLWHGAQFGLISLNTKLLPYNQRIACFNAAATVLYAVLVLSAALYFRAFPLRDSEGSFTLVQQG